MTERIDVGVMGATGLVGRCLVEWIEGHPWFQLAEVGASPASTGRRFGDLLEEAGDFLPDALSAATVDLRLKSANEKWRSPLILSALPSRVAGPAEEALAREGHLVVSNASSHRMDSDVPLLVPEINPEHLDLLRTQRERWTGGIVTNPNCSVAGLVMALAPLQREFGIARVSVTTLQAISGAGRPGPAAAELLDNILPFIPGEEEKLAEEPQKILGELRNGRVELASFAVSAQVHRVPVAHGHLLAVSVQLVESATPSRVREVLAGFRGAVLDERLPSVPEPAIVVLDDEMRPQPKLDRDRGRGMVVSVGRVRSCAVLDVKFSVLAHNLHRGAAGAAVLNAELCHICGAIQGG